MSPAHVRRLCALAETSAESRTARQSLRWAHKADALPSHEIRHCGAFVILLLDCNTQPGHVARWLYSVVLAGDQPRHKACGFATSRDDALFKAGLHTGRHDHAQ